MSDIIERLRAHMGKADIGDVLPDCREAADEIERLRSVAQRATPEQMGRAYYLARYEKDGAKWEANDHKMLWVRMAQRYHEILASSDTSTDGGLPETLRRNDREHL